MIEKRFQHKVVKGSMTLPATIFIVLALWIVGAFIVTPSLPTAHPSIVWDKVMGWLSDNFGLATAGCLCCALTSYLLQELHNTYALIRTRTTFIITTFIVWMGACTFLHPFQQGNLLQACCVLTLFSLFRGYQHEDDVNSICQAFFWFAVSCLIYPKLVLLIPMLFIGMHFFQCLSPRTFFAGIIGFLIPYWFLMAYAVYSQQMELVTKPFIEMIAFTKPDYQVLELPQWLSFGLMTVLTFCTSIYYMANSYLDKIRVRSFLHHLIVLATLLFIGILLQPSDFNALFSLYLMIGAILQAQFFALTLTKVTNICFIVCITLIALLAFVNLWNPSLISF